MYIDTKNNVLVKTIMNVVRSKIIEFLFIYYVSKIKRELHCCTARIPF
jgi:hypothetical protein